MVLLFNIIHHVAQRNIPILYPVQPPLHPIHVWGVEKPVFRPKNSLCGRFRYFMHLHIFNPVSPNVTQCRKMSLSVAYQRPTYYQLFFQIMPMSPNVAIGRSDIGSQSRPTWPINPLSPNTPYDALLNYPKLSLQFPCKQVGRKFIFHLRQIAV